MRLETDQASFQCAYCSATCLPEPNADGVSVLGEPSKLNCPGCATPLVHAVAGERRMFYCTGCRGMLIPIEFFPAIIQELRSRRHGAPAPVRPLDPNELERKTRCPKCGRRMDTHPYGGGGAVVLDACESCAWNWLDAGELDQIASVRDRQYSDHAWEPV
jgi:Zn-finger nucleic acid-binding protein